MTQIHTSVTAATDATDATNTMPYEFQLIHQHFKPLGMLAHPQLIHSIGDDCALFGDPTQSTVWAISHDALNEHTHFFNHSSPEEIAHKALAVNLSDMAAMGATPCFFLLSLSLPHVSKNAQSSTQDKFSTAWLAAFSSSLGELARQHNCILIGGDTTQGPFSIGITILGTVPPKQALYRHNAQIGDDIWLTGALGQARLALAHYWGQQVLAADAFNVCRQALYYPPSRVRFMQSLLGIAHAAIDVSDGLIADLKHLLQASNQHAQLIWSQFVLSPTVQQLPELAQKYAATLAGGDDYEVCFTAASHQRACILKLAQQHQTPIYRVGSVVAVDAAATQSIVLYQDANLLQKIDLNALHLTSFMHF